MLQLIELFRLNSSISSTEFIEHSIVFYIYRNPTQRLAGYQHSVKNTASLMAPSTLEGSYRF